MEPNPTQVYGAGKESPAQIVPFTDADRAFFESKKFSISKWLTFLIICAIAWLAYEIFTSGASIWVNLGFCILVGLCVYLFRYFFVTKTSRILAHGMKHIGRARIEKKIAYQGSDGRSSVLALRLDWPHKKEIPIVHVSSQIYAQLQENELAYIEASPLSKLPITIKKVAEAGEAGF